MKASWILRRFLLPWSQQVSFLCWICHRSPRPRKKILHRKTCRSDLNPGLRASSSGESFGESLLPWTSQDKGPYKMLNMWSTVAVCPKQAKIISAMQNVRCVIRLWAHRWSIPYCSIFHTLDKIHSLSFVQPPGPIYREKARKKIPELCCS